MIIDKDKKIHRHIDQLIARVPDLGVAQEAVEISMSEKDDKGRTEATRAGLSTSENDNVEGSEGVTRGRSARKPPSWTNTSICLLAGDGGL